MQQRPIGSFAGSTSWPASCGSACSTSSTSSTSRPSRRRRRPARRPDLEVRRAAGAALFSLGRGRYVDLRCGAAEQFPRPGRWQRIRRRASRCRARWRRSALGRGSERSCSSTSGVLIWPNQKKILGMVPATDEEKAKARRHRVPGLAREHDALDPDALLHGDGTNVDRARQSITRATASARSCRRARSIPFERALRRRARTDRPNR